MKTRIWLRSLLMLAGSTLVACGGASFGDGTGGGLLGGGGGGGGGAGTPAVVLVSASQESVFADGTSTVLISAILTDAQGVPISGRTIDFSTDAGTLVATSDTTNANGLAEVFLRAPTARGTATVLARERETDLTGSVSVEFVAGLVQRLAATLAPTKLAPRAVAEFTVTALDGNDNPVPGQSIAFETVPNGVGGIFNPATVSTDENGRAQTAFEVGPNTGTFTLRARTASGVVTTAELTVATQASLQLSVTPSQPSILADGVSTAVITAVLTDSNGIPIPDRAIDFSTNAGQLLQTTATTDANGAAAVTLRSSAIRGIATIVARDAATNISGSTAVQFVTGQSAQLATTLNPTTVAAGGTTTFTATVRDGNGNPVAGEVVSFDTTSGSGTFDRSTVETDANGRAEALFTAASVGTTTLRARTAGGLSSSQQLTVLQPDLLLTLSATPPTSAANGSTVIEITAQLRDFNDNPIPNRTVTFTTNLGTLLAGSALTNDAGIARVNLRAPTQAGTARVTAQVPSSSASSSVAIEFTAGVASQIVLSVTPSTIAPGATATVNATIRDANGNPVAGGDVTFNVSPSTCGSFSPATVGTGPSGNAGSTFTAGPNTGVCTISATSDGGLNASAQLTVAAGVIDITLLSDAPNLPSSADTFAEGVTITALVRGAGNKLLQGVKVDFSASQGALQILGGGITDASGAARAVLTTGGNPRNQDVVVTATAEGANRSISIPVTGTKLEIVGPAVVGSGDVEEYVITLRDAANAPIPNQTVQVTSLDLGNPIVFVNGATTNSQGRVTVRYTGASGGSDRLEVMSIGVTAVQLIEVSTSKLVFEAPAPSAEVLFETAPMCSTDVTVRLTENGAPVNGANIDFAITRGFINANPGTSTASATTNIDGRATVQVCADGPGNAGGAVISATASMANVSASLPLEFVATSPFRVDLQAEPAVIPINGTATIRAVVRDVDDNLVKNQRVNFTLSDPTGGALTAAFGITDSLGTTTVTYRASATSSATDAIRVTGTLASNPGISGAATLTVGNQALRILLGTGNEIAEPNTTSYAMPWVVIVTDAAGNPPPPDTVLRISVEPTAYQKGYYVADLVNQVWVAQYEVTGGDVRPSNSTVAPQPPDFGCENEDVDRNGILDAGEDLNGNMLLDPGGVAVAPSAPALDANGTANFDIVYPQTHGNWVQMRLRAQATVAGTQSLAIADFVLPVLADDVNDLEVSPPGVVRQLGSGSVVASPYGLASNCLDPN
ncbi:Ig-like domain-containing protein [Sinimarinibacterium sp. HSW-8]|uniref:Ig-like domain-containing protein n=1 Tax=Sinimarinibacterium thermocellulolyticum TaxID=3170016 RepID=A0ABV2ACQ5_9GAMM